MEPKGSLLCSQEPASSPYSEPDDLHKPLVYKIYLMKMGY
jgi:hypothetical protein